MNHSLTLTPLTGFPPVEADAPLAELIAEALARAGLELVDADILVVCQKVVSKSEGRVVRLDDVDPSPLAQAWADQWPEKDARFVELILRESRRIVRMDRGHLIVETGPGWVCANAGIDASNSPREGDVVLLPQDPDRSAATLREALQRSSGARVAVLITDTWGRPWREGILDFAIGVAGMDALVDLRGSRDLNGRILHHTIYAQADALAAAAGLLMRKDNGVPAVHIRGYSYPQAPGSARPLIRDPNSDLFR